MEATIIQLAYGHEFHRVSAPTAGLQAIVTPKECGQPADEEALLWAALADPIGTPSLRDMARPGQRVVIVTSDLTRPCPSARLLPPLLEELAEGGVPDADVTIVMALGLHRPMTEAEIEQAVGPAITRRIRVLNHDPADTVRLGETSRGTPVEIFRPVVEADFRICLANIEFHYMAGFSGGAKSVLPGCASRDAIQANHSLMVRPDARAGRLVDNPLRADLEAGVALLGVDFILNVVVDDDHHRVVGAFAGDVTQAHRRGCDLVAERGQAPISQLADVVLVSAGGFPKDINLYQAQKALDNAAQAVRVGGVIVLVAECAEGFGNQTFENWMTESPSPDDRLARLQQSFVLGGHKAAAIAAVQKQASVLLVSRLPDDGVRRCGLWPYPDPQRALQAAMAQTAPGASVLVMPQGGAVLPQLIE
jgi:nickel-dependent lactate racemase